MESEVINMHTIVHDIRETLTTCERLLPLLQGDKEDLAKMTARLTSCRQKLTVASNRLQITMMTAGIAELKALKGRK